MKRRLVSVLQPMMADIQQRRAAVTDDVVKHFMTVRPLRSAPGGSGAEASTPAQAK